MIIMTGYYGIWVIRVANLSAMEDCIITAVVQSCEMFLNLLAGSWFGLVKYEL